MWLAGWLQLRGGQGRLSACAGCAVVGWYDGEAAAWPHVRACVALDGLIACPAASLAAVFRHDVYACELRLLQLPVAACDSYAGADELLVLSWLMRVEHVACLGVCLRW